MAAEGGSLIADHDTLLNPHDQTANVFTKTDFGDLNTVTVTDNLMAGGGYMVYGGEGGVGSVVGPVTVTGNRFARCGTAPVADRGGGHYCERGPDAHGYWPEGWSLRSRPDLQRRRHHLEGQLLGRHRGDGV